MFVLLQLRRQTCSLVAAWGGWGLVTAFGSEMGQCAQQLVGCQRSSLGGGCPVAVSPVPDDPSVCQSMPPCRSQVVRPSVNACICRHVCGVVGTVRTEVLLCSAFQALVGSVVLLVLLGRRCAVSRAVLCFNPEKSEQTLGVRVWAMPLLYCFHKHGCRCWAGVW